MIVQKIVTAGLAIHSYLIGDEKTKTIAVIDPTRDAQKFIDLSKSQGFKIKYILETHVHADFISGSFELKKALNDKPVICCSCLGGKEWTPNYTDRKINEGDVVSFGNVTLKAIHTPGHTPEHISWELYDQNRPCALFSGDFVFIGDVGRPDLLGDEAKKKLAKEQYESIFKGLSLLPKSLELFPAHGAGSLCGKALGAKTESTLEHEWRENPSLQKKPVDVWISHLMDGMPKAPPYFLRMKKLNVIGAPLLLGKLPGKELNEMDKSAFILDVRPMQQYQKGHVAGSMNIPVSPQLTFWAGWLVPYDQPIQLVIDRSQDVQAILWQLLLIGLDNIKGWIYADCLKMEEVLEVIKMSDLDEKYVVDVRSLAEWEGGHLPKSHHLPLGEIPEKYQTLPKDRSIAVVCQGGYRSNIGASFLQKLGFKKVSAVSGGLGNY